MKKIYTLYAPHYKIIIKIKPDIIIEKLNIFSFLSLLTGIPNKPKWSIKVDSTSCPNNPIPAVSVIPILDEDRLFKNMTKTLSIPGRKRMTGVLLNLGSLFFTIIDTSKINRSPKTW